MASGLGGNYRCLGQNVEVETERIFRTLDLKAEGLWSRTQQS